MISEYIYTYFFYKEGMSNKYLKIRFTRGEVYRDGKKNWRVCANCVNPFLTRIQNCAKKK